MTSYRGKRTDELTDEDRAAARADWEASEAKVRGKPTRLAFPKINRNPGPPNRFDREDCEGCRRLLARGTLVPTEVAGKWKFLCRECRVTSLIEREND